MLWRKVTTSDLAICFEMQPACIGDQLLSRSAALRAWNELLRSPSFLGMVIEADHPIAGNRIVACGLGVFVSSWFADREIAAPQPGLNSRIIGSVVAGQPVVMDYKELAFGNAGNGVDFVNMYGTWRDGCLGPQETLEVHALMAASFVEEHAGYRLNRILKEAVGAPQRDLARASGMWKIICEFQESDSALLMVQSRENALEVPYSTMAALYHYRAPVLGFRETHQQLLHEALRGATDSELAVKLGVSVAAIKKRWLSIFTRIEEVKPELLEFFEPDTELNDPKRGPQKRHRIISYVRGHPEELRPYFTPPKTRNSRPEPEHED